MKKVLLIIFISLQLQAHSQFWRRFLYGVTYSHDVCFPIYNSDVHPYDTLDYYGNGFHTGLQLLRPLNRHLSIETGFYFQNASYSSSKYHYVNSPIYVSNTLVTDYSSESTFKFLNIPLGIRYYFNGDRLSLFAGCKVVPALLTAHMEKYNYYDDDDLVLRHSFYLKDAKKFNLSGQLGAGISFFLSYYMHIDIMAGYSHSLMPVIKTDLYKEYLHSFDFTFTISQSL